MQKWEYLTFSVDDNLPTRPNVKVARINGVLCSPKEQKTFYSYLQELGEQGWELVSVQVDRADDAQFYLKRPKQNSN